MLFSSQFAPIASTIVLKARINPRHKFSLPLSILHNAGFVDNEPYQIKRFGLPRNLEREGLSSLRQWSRKKLSIPLPETDKNFIVNDVSIWFVFFFFKSIFRFYILRDDLLARLLPALIAYFCCVRVALKESGKRIRVLLAKKVTTWNKLLLTSLFDCHQTVKGFLSKFISPGQPKPLGT